MELREKMSSTLPGETLNKTMCLMYDAAWESLDQYVRPRIQELDGRWLAAENYLPLKAEGFPYAPKGAALLELQAIIDKVQQQIETKMIKSLEGPPFTSNMESCQRAIDSYLLIRKLFPRVEELRNIFSPH
ncbi:hypothetical protein OHS18_28575 [Amycolatopsis sp. NBC_00355]|uniref:hypothetical protein n=1 Tax=Amycolatopsis sp. NBC_00355 TaxID=2975957 RepID=UPI002E26758A